jgi:hypothetical protein
MFERPKNDGFDIPDDIDDEIEELAYDWAEEITAWSKKNKTWPLERHIADGLKACLREIWKLKNQT